MDIILVPILSVLLHIFYFYSLGLFIYVILSWLEHFNVVNRFHPFVYSLHGILFRLYEPILARLRTFLPTLGGIDLSPIALWLALTFIQQVLTRVMIRFI